MLQCYKDWHAFAKETRNPDMPLSDIILVTGCDLTREWATVVFTQKTSDASVGFTAGGIPSSSQSMATSFWGNWTTETSVPHRCGPQRTIPSMDEDYTSGVVTAPTTSDPGQRIIEDNQCVFIRGYRVQERRLFPKRLRAAAGPSIIPDQDDPEQEIPPLV